MPPKRYIIVNADDFGYYDCVSRGILSAADSGVVTATGVFANSPFLGTHLEWLDQHSALDVGVHLNLTDRSPVTLDLQTRLQQWNGMFPGKFVMAGLILTGRLPVDVITRELRAQIEHCIASGMKLCFLNSHEHIHMLPPVFRITQDLATYYDIPHVRYALPDSISSLSPGALIRDMALKILGISNKRSLRFPLLPFLGMSASGKLNLAYLRHTFSGLPPGVYELMCHPGTCDSNDDTSSEHRHYHNWKGEFDTLESDGFRDLCRQQNISLIGYRHTRIVSGRVEAVIEKQ
jgi:hypothetical protein